MPASRFCYVVGSGRFRLAIVGNQH
jgi:hypothetical protein